MDGLTREVRLAIAEEVLADTIAHDPLLAEEMMKLMKRKVIKPKHRKRYAEMLRGAVVRGRSRTQLRPEL